ncbi:MAG: hypothetical protein ACOYK6_08505 [Chthoniobacterales bacterium]
MSNFVRNLHEGIRDFVLHGSPWNGGNVVSVRDVDVACGHLKTISTFPDDNRQITTHTARRTEGLTTIHTPRSYTQGDPAPSLLGHLINAFTISPEKNISVRNILHQLCSDIESVFGEEITTHFKSKFYSHLFTSTTPTKEELMQFFEEHHITHLLEPPTQTTAELSSEATNPIQVQATTTVLKTLNEGPQVNAEEVNHPLNAIAINDQEDPNFGAQDIPNVINLDNIRGTNATAAETNESTANTIDS